MSESLNLRALVREVEASCVDVSPAAIAAQVMAHLKRAQYEDALLTALPVFVRQVQSEQRSRLLHVSPVAPGGGTTATESVRVAAVREDWRRVLMQVVHLGVTSDARSKRLRDCSRDDLLHAAALRDQQASRNASKAREYRVLAGLLAEHDAATVNDLPADILSRALASAA